MSSIGKSTEETAHGGLQAATGESTLSASTTPLLTAEDLLRSAFKYQDALVSYAYGLLQDWALAQDAVQEAFIVLQKKHTEFRADASVFAWARQIVRFEALNIRRARQRELRFIDDELVSLVDQQFERHLDLDSVGALESRKAALQHCMAKLDGDSVTLLLGFYKDALSCEKLADAQRKSVNAVRLSLSRIRSKLRDCVRHHLALTEVRP
jgi:RNA polymerase sigma-70 factor (ECF subfamily)